MLSAVAGVCCIVVETPIESRPYTVRPQCVVIQASGHSTSDLADVVIEPDQSLSTLVDNIQHNPIAAALLVQLVRENINRSIESALFAESLAYSTLQHSERFLDWLANDKPTNVKSFKDEPIQAQRNGDQLTLTLNRPENRNAWSTPMRDALAEHLQMAIVDESINSIQLQANGPAFGAGGDLTEFGAARDAGVAHITRQTRSPALLMHLLREKITACVHGACVGAGIELPAFAARVRAREGAFFQLPEVAFGLIPGAGGTASILHRIGRSRFNYMALSSERVDLETALRWGLVDSLES